MGGFEVRWVSWMGEILGNGIEEEEVEVVLIGWIMGLKLWWKEEFGWEYNK